MELLVIGYIDTYSRKFYYISIYPILDRIYYEFILKIQ